MGMLWDGHDTKSCPLENISVCLVTNRNLKLKSEDLTSSVLDDVRSFLFSLRKRITVV